MPIAAMSRPPHAHWLWSIVRGLASGSGHEPEVPVGAPIREAWAAVSAACRLSEESLALYVAAHFRLEVADLASAQPVAAKLLPASVARRYEIFPLRADDRQLVVATSNPVDTEAEQAIRFASSRVPVMEVASPGALAAAIAVRYSPDKVVEVMMEHVDDEVETLVQVVDTTAPAQVTSAEVETSPVIKLSNLLLRDAVQQRASDVHIQPGAATGVVRFRIDGVLRPYMQLPMPVLDRVVSRIKVIGQLDITNRLRPQDGRTTIALGDRRIDLRISTVPTRESEKAVIRLLDPVAGGGLDSVGISAFEVARLRRLLAHREGLLVVTGPTGSGKTTTLYAALRELATDDINIMTVEDPIEYELKGMTQMQVEPKQGVTFASALRAILRQDPDVIFVGEIRDLETAEMAVQASLTGHLVLATLHTNSAAGAVRRLSDLGLDRAAIGDTLRGALAQRLVRRTCLECAVPVVDPLGVEELQLQAAFGQRPTLRTVGCPACGQTGYHGRLPIVEVFQTTNEMQALIASGVGAARLHEEAVAAGMRSLRHVALERVQRNETTLEEVQRVIGDSASTGDEAPSGAVRESDETAGLGLATADPPPTNQRVQSTVGDRAPEAGPDPRKHVLVVDDEATNRAFARALLEQSGFRVSEAPDGRAALDLLDAEAHDLLILDLDMPRLSGYEVLGHVRRQLATAALPVVVLTGSSSHDAEVEVIERGADDYIRKPIDARPFMARVHATLRRSAG